MKDMERKVIPESDETTFADWTIEDFNRAFKDIAGRCLDYESPHGTVTIIRDREL